MVQERSVQVHNRASWCIFAISEKQILRKAANEARRRKEVSPPYHFVRAFGSVPAAIEAAGAAKRIYSREEMITILRELDTTLDRPIPGSDIKGSYAAGKGPSLKMFQKLVVLPERRLLASRRIGGLNTGKNTPRKN